jgi:hypothetical protein
VCIQKTHEQLQKIFLYSCISPTHKRTDGRAPVWGYEFTSKDAALQGGVGKIAARLNIKFCDLVVIGGILPPSRPILLYTEIKVRNRN